jgi:hypothetical protein
MGGVGVDAQDQIPKVLLPGIAENDLLGGFEGAQDGVELHVDLVEGQIGKPLDSQLEGRVGTVGLGQPLDERLGVIWLR